MKITRLMLAGGLLGWSIATTAVAQDIATQNARRDSAVRPVAFAYDNYLGDASKEAAPQKTTEPAACCDAEAACGGCKSSACRWCTQGKLADPWTLFGGDALKDRNIAVGGWLDGGIYSNQWGQGSTNGGGGNGPVGMRTLSNSFELNQAWVFAEKKTDTQGYGWDIGGRIDFLMGTDAGYTQCYGDGSWDYNWDMNGGWYQSAMPQIYAEIAYNDLKVKAGHFYTPIGNEVVQAPLNFFYSHSYAHTYGEPFTHTGALATYALNEKLSVLGGWTNGWDEGFRSFDRGSTFLGGLVFTANEKNTMAWYCSAGKLGNGAAFGGTGASGDIIYNCFLWTHKFNEKATYIFEADIGNNDNVTVPGAVDNQWYALVNYLTYKLNDCWSVGGRLEWFQDPQGARVLYEANDAFFGAHGDYFELTCGVNYKPHANLTIRPEIRYDWLNTFTDTAVLPFDNGTKDTQLSGGVDVIFTF